MKTISLIVVLLTLLQEFAYANPKAGAIVGWGSIHFMDAMAFHHFHNLLLMW